MTKLFMGCESLLPGNGGICRVARLTTKVIAEEAAKSSLSARTLVLNDPVLTTNLGVPFESARGSRARFVYGVTKAAFTQDHFVYDCLGMARAHCRLPLLRRPFLTFICGIEVWKGARPDRIACARRASVLVAISEYTRARAERDFGCFSHARVCWLGTETDEAPSPAPERNGAPRVLIVARMDNPSYKGHAELIQAWPTVVAAVPDAILTIVGTGDGAAEYKSMSGRLPCADRIEFRGFVPDEEMDDVWSQTTLFAMPSRGEGFGLVYIEAMRHSVPVIASVHDAAPEINVDGYTGYNVNLERREGLAEKIIYLLRNRDHAAELGSNGQRRWHEHFRYSAFRSRFVPILSDFLSF
jgi:phosphatidylinositol alpha-1,6-mannosyltransferase